MEVQAGPDHHIKSPYESTTLSLPMSPKSPRKDPLQKALFVPSTHVSPQWRQIFRSRSFDPVATREPSKLQSTTYTSRRLGEVAVEAVKWPVWVEGALVDPGLEEENGPTKVYRLWNVDWEATCFEEGIFHHMFLLLPQPMFS